MKRDCCHHNLINDRPAPRSVERHARTCFSRESRTVPTREFTSGITCVLEGGNGIALRVTDCDKRGFPNIFRA